MSCWTHVVCTFRIDCYPRLDMEDIKKYLDKTIGVPDCDEFTDRFDLINRDYDMTFSDMRRSTGFDRRLVPFGSEGGLHRDIIVNPYESSLFAYTVVLQGDLRDYGNVPEDMDDIERWFTTSCAQFERNDPPTFISIRQAVIYAFSERPNISDVVKTYSWNDNFNR